MDIKMRPFDKNPIEEGFYLFRTEHSYKGMFGQVVYKVGFILSRAKWEEGEVRVDIRNQKITHISVNPVTSEAHTNRLSEIIGKWPGDESFEDLSNMLTK